MPEGFVWRKLKYNWCCEKHEGFSKFNWERQRCKECANIIGANRILRDRKYNKSKLPAGERHVSDNCIFIIED